MLLPICTLAVILKLLCKCCGKALQHLWTWFKSLLSVVFLTKRVNCQFLVWVLAAVYQIVILRKRTVIHQDMDRYFC